MELGCIVGGAAVHQSMVKEDVFRTPSSIAVAEQCAGTERVICVSSGATGCAGVT